MASKIGDEWMEWATVVNKDWFQTPSLPWERIPDYIATEIEKLVINGAPTRLIARLIGYDARQVRRFIRVKYPHLIDAPCECGLSRRHQGWCRYRFNRSELRQSVMRLIHLKRFALSCRSRGMGISETRAAVASQVARRTL